MKAVVGLGNPGTKYDRTRHNVGFWVIDGLAKELGAGVKKTKGLSLVGRTEWSGATLFLVKPQTYMNESGRAVKELVDREALAPDEVLVVYDDLDLEPGCIRLRSKGSAGGHNGIRSIINYLGTQDFPRLRLGIGSVPAGIPGTQYVLSRPGKEEAENITAAVDVAVRAALLWVTDGIDPAMSKYNGMWGSATPLGS